MDSYIDIGFHVITSLILGFFVWKIFGMNDRKSLLISLSSTFLGGVLIDLDHFIDHLLAFGLNFNYEYFINGEYFLRSGKTYIFFHGFEYAVLFGIAAVFIKSKKWKMILSALTFGMLSHLLIDTFLFTNPIKGYFILYRIFHGFNVDMSGGVLD